jgi:hypothetical protein
MRNVEITFEFLSPDTTTPIGYKWIPLNMIFDVKMDFTWKARLVARGHRTDPPSSMTYSSVVSRESVRIAFLLAALNDLEVLTADIGNAYLNAPTKEKVYSTAGKEFGSWSGETVIIVRALYGLKSSGAAWRAHLASSIMSLSYTSCLANPDVWYQSATKVDGTRYYEYLLVYVDDTLVFSHEPQVTMTALSKLYRMKEGSIGKPTKYLGADVIEYRLPTDHQRPKWGFSSQQYVTEAIKNVEMELTKFDQGLINSATTPFTSGYRPELDLSPLLDDEQTNWFQNLIGILHWSIELGRIDIHIEVAMLASFLVQPRVGHLDHCLHIFAYLKKHKKSTMVFDDTLPNIDESRFHQADWSTFYNYAKESLPPNAPEPRGKPVNMYAFVDTDHAGDKISRCSHTGILIFLNRAPILWYSKKQNTVETSTFGSEFVAMRIATELIESLHYKLRMMGVFIETPTNVFCDNQSVVMNTTIPEFALSRKHNAIAYHKVREAVAANIIRIAKEHTDTYLADLLTKPLNSAKRKALLENILF